MNIRGEYGRLRDKTTLSQVGMLIWSQVHGFWKIHPIPGSSLPEIILEVTAKQTTTNTALAFAYTPHHVILLRSLKH